MGYKSRSTFITMKLNTENLKILNYFYKKSWIRHYLIKNDNKIFVYLRYINNKPLFYNIELVSTPGNRIYLQKKSNKY